MTAAGPGRRSPERLVFFSDAVVAIAITLLVLPLADSVPDAVARGEAPAELVTASAASIGSFLLSFAVIARLWVVHHRLFARVVAVGGPLVLVNFVWLATIALLPFPTEMVGTYGDDRFTEAFYVGTLAVSVAAQTMISLVVRYDRTVAPDPGPDPSRLVLANLGALAALVAGLVLVLTVDGVSYEVLLLLLLPLAVGGVRRRFRRGRT